MSSDSKDRDPRNRGVLFGNERKREGKKDADLKGRINIDGVEHWLSAWFFTYEKDGAQRRGINVVIGDEVAERDGAKPARQASRPAARDDDIPF